MSAIHGRKSLHVCPGKSAPPAAWFRLARFGLLVRSGIYTQIKAQQYSMRPQQWSHAQYEKLATAWRPSAKAPHHWARLAKQAGCRYLIITSRGTDGFCLFNTQTTDFNSVACGPRRDLVREYVDACRAEGLRVGMHYSIHDGHNVDCDRSYYDHNARRRYVNYLHTQIRELCSHYGKLDILRYDDCWFSAQDIDAVELNAMVRQLQPGILINNRAKRTGDFNSLTAIPGTVKDGRMWELCVPATRDISRLDQWQTPYRLVALLEECATKGGNLLLEVTANAQGNIPPPANKLLAETGRRLKQFHPSLYRALDMNSMGEYLAGRFTAWQNKLYFHCGCRPDHELVIRGLASKVLSARVMGGAHVRFRQTPGQLRLCNLPAITRQTFPPVVELELHGKPRPLARYSEEQPLRLWHSIVSEMAELQDAGSTLRCHGQVLNPIYARPHIHDTASAAKIFATEYRRTLDPAWQRRSRLALNAVAHEPIYAGLCEPMCRMDHWDYYIGSLFTTGLTIDAVWNAMILLHRPFQNVPWRRLLDYLESCRGGRGSFWHNQRAWGADPYDDRVTGVQNTSVIALYLMEVVVRRASRLRHPVLEQRAAVYRNVRHYQMPDGLWAYMFNRARQTSDIMHHCLELYYLAKATVTAGRQHQNRATIRDAWYYVRRQLTTDGVGNDCIDWRGERKPQQLEGGNLRDTNAYFLILASVPWLARLGVIDDRDLVRTDGLVRHIIRRLMECKGCHPCIKPREVPDAMLGYFIANLENSTAWRGALMADWIADRLGVNIC